MSNDEPTRTFLAEDELPPPDHPMAVARVLLAETHNIQGLELTKELTQRYWRGDWMRWDGNKWIAEEDNILRGRIYQRLEHAWYMHETKNGMEPKEWRPTKDKINKLLDAMKILVYLPRASQPPTWLNSTDSTVGLVACANGLLDVSARKLLPHTPQYFNDVSVPFDYLPNAPQPKLWLKFLNQLWNDDPDSIKLLQQWFGYILSGRTNQQKMLVLVGPARSGKGTIARVLRALIGTANTASPTLGSLGTQFGMWSLLGKTLAIIADARLSGSGVGGGRGRLELRNEGGPPHH